MRSLVPFRLIGKTIRNPHYAPGAASKRRRPILRTFRPPEGGGFTDPRWGTMNIPSPEGEGFGDTAQAGYSSASGRLSFRVRTHACPTRLAICARTPRSPRSAFLLAFRCFGPKPHASGLPDARAASPSPEGEGFTDPRWETLNYRDRPTHRPPSQMREGMHRYRSRAIPGTSRGRSSRGS